MKILRIVALLAAGLALPQAAIAGEAEYAGMVAAHARANGVPEALVHRVIMRESRYQPHLVGRGGTIGLMQIKLATARGVGYTGDAAGLRDPNTNLTYAVKYLAGAYRAANGDHARAVRYFAGGYYYAAKRQRQEAAQVAHAGETMGQPWLEPNGNPQPMFAAPAHRKLAQRVRNARAQALK
ncbi:lytic transglycosylase domain-containing protein [Bradyrhizobium sp. CNPSo 4010]|uniref:Lytic transglycosylase domain-containing protein n=1 Tax=Bradyrhizobium agreste TaxID=2751811 RepID=A0ABS0Q1D3_9BRAD|nr:lytic transglycosylase domain-containing protein [Bradyrhizobium agreste]MBH5403145.1 lytic transglycosylase domain-containing protein [Bradyrhizobium agreste]